MSRKMDKILAEISAGELIDKITILEIKKEKISNKEKLIEVDKELVSLNETLKKSINDCGNPLGVYASIIPCVVTGLGKNGFPVSPKNLPVLAPIRG